MTDRTAEPQAASEASERHDDAVSIALRNLLIEQLDQQLAEAQARIAAQDRVIAEVRELPDRWVDMALRQSDIANEYKSERADATNQALRACAEMLREALDRSNTEQQALTDVMDVKVFTRALSDDEVQHGYETGEWPDR